MINLKQWFMRKKYLTFSLGLIVENLKLVKLIGPYGPKLGRIVFMFTMTDSQKTTLTVTATDKKGNPATMPTGSVEWFVDNVSVIALTPNGLSCDAAAVGPLGV